LFGVRFPGLGENSADHHSAYDDGSIKRGVKAK
jgi:hypothetical protein